jgi:hypothetical protein
VAIKIDIYVFISNQLVPKAQQVKRDKGTRTFIFRLVTVYYIYNIGVLTVNIEFMWRGLGMGEIQALSEKLYLGQ